MSAELSMKPDAVLAILAPEAVAQLDRLAEQTDPPVAVEALRAIQASDDRLRVPRHISSGGENAQRVVDLDPLLAESS
jgi:hypothetical protein